MKVVLYTRFGIGKNHLGVHSQLISNIKNEIEKIIGKSVLVYQTDRQNKLGLLKVEKPLDQFNCDVLLCFPMDLFLSVPKAIRKKTIVLGSDNMVLLFKRFKEIEKNKFVAFKLIILIGYFLWFQRKMLLESKKILLVGIEDIKAPPYYANKKVSYLTHPNLFKKNWSSFKGHKRRFVLSGDLSRKYVGTGLSLVEALFKNEPSWIEKILVVGKNNYWIYSALNKKLKATVEYVEWVENYKDICLSGYDIHLAPLLAGAGTKNRILSCLDFGVPVIGTSICFENIVFGQHSDNVGLFFFNSTNVLEKVKNFEPSKNIDLLRKKRRMEFSKQLRAAICI